MQARVSSAECTTERHLFFLCSEFSDACFCLTKSAVGSGSMVQAWSGNKVFCEAAAMYRMMVYLQEDLVGTLGLLD